MQIDKNDVSLAKLFNWGRKFEITDKYGNPATDVYIRLVGDAELNQARVKAIRASRELREKLKDQNSDERMVFMPDFDEMTDEAIAELITLQKVREFVQEANREVDLPLPIEPHTDAPLERQEEYQKLVDEYPQKRQETLNAYVIGRANELTAQLKNENRTYLVKECERQIISARCEEEMIKKFSEYCAFFGTYKDEEFKIRYFEDIDEFENLPTEIQQQFISGYQSLDINVTELKKSLEVTQ